METRVILTNMTAKPADCTECPLCNEHDECQALPWHETSWEKQYAKCPLQECNVRKVMKGEQL